MGYVLMSAILSFTASCCVLCCLAQEYNWIEPNLMKGSGGRNYFFGGGRVQRRVWCRRHPIGGVLHFLTLNLHWSFIFNLQLWNRVIYTLQLSKQNKFSPLLILKAIFYFLIIIKSDSISRSLYLIYFKI